MQISKLMRNRKATAMVALSLMGTSIMCASYAPGVGAEPLKEAPKSTNPSSDTRQSGSSSTSANDGRNSQLLSTKESKEGKASKAEASSAAEPANRNGIAHPVSLSNGSGSATSSTLQSTTDGAANASVDASASGASGASADGTANGATGDAAPAKMMWKPGMPISINMETEDILPTDDPELARQQAEKYADSPEAAFILAVALTRTSHVEEALKQVRHARRLAQSKGGPGYFNKMTDSYEKMLESYPDDNRVRYGLAWAYYMKAYMLSENAKRANAAAGKSQEVVAAEPVKSAKNKNVNVQTAGAVLAMIDPKLSANLPTDGKVSNSALPHIPSAMENVPPSVAPKVKQYYEAALKNLDDLLARKPDDVWARVYRAHLAAEYSGDLPSSMAVWRDCQSKYPQNPASYFFLGEGYLKQGNLKECLSNITRAIALRALGN